MVSISLCMIVKNEAKVLARCLDSIRELMDEIIIVDTGSTDETRKIALDYTDKVYDFEWVNDFSAARNFAFSKAACDYIYTADADEVLDAENREKFRILKETLLSEIEIVQMYYGNQLENGTVYNFDRELRPKLFKRNRNFQWIEPVHETVRLLPVVYDSDIEITHLPERNHAGRDIKIFERLIQSGEVLSGRLFEFYARELFVSGTKEDFANAFSYFANVADSSDAAKEQLKMALCIAARACFEKEDYLSMFRYAMKEVAEDASSETCCILGSYYQRQKDYKEAILWFYNAAYEQGSILNIRYQKEIPLLGMIECYRKLGMEEMAEHYEIEIKGLRDETIDDTINALCFEENSNP